MLGTCEPGAAAAEENTPSSQNKSPMRDEEYYLADGSCVLLVQDTLFNVHRTILTKDSSSFSAMFTLPQGTLRPEGLSDDNPIKLPGDTASEFRNLLWALYSLPHELTIVHTAQAPLPRLVDIAKLSNKYNFKSLEQWSLDAIQEYVNRKPSPIIASNPLSYTFSPSSSSADQFTSLIRLAQLCSHWPLLTTLITLLRQLMNASIQYAYLAMTIADELDLKTLRGAAYAEVMQRALLVKECPIFITGPLPSSTPPTIIPTTSMRIPRPTAEDDTLPLLVSPTPEAYHDHDHDPPLTSVQKLRLLMGYYRLTRAWDFLRLHPPPFGHSSSCCAATWHQHQCIQGWIEFWKEKTGSEAVISLPPSDVIGRLRAMAKEFDRWGNATYMHHDCRLNAKKVLMEKIEVVEGGLGDVFWEG